MNINGSIALVTGPNGGIGHAIIDERQAWGGQDLFGGARPHLACSPMAGGRPSAGPTHTRRHRRGPGGCSGEDGH